MEIKRLTPVKAIRQKCLECCAGQVNEVRLCNIKTCALHPYRMGHRPKDDYFINDGNEDEKTADSPTKIKK